MDIICSVARFALNPFGYNLKNTSKTATLSLII